VLSGSYQGKDVFVRNPYVKNLGRFCTQQVFVNDRKVFDQPKVSAYKIDLSYLEINDLVVIRITHSEGCQPSIVNPHVLKSNSSFKFITTETDNNSISWKTKGEEIRGSYIIEQKTDEADWGPIDTVTAKAELDINRYIIAAPHQKGVNHYRIKYVDSSGLENYSLEMLYTKKEQITFYPSIATTSLTLSDTAKYIITDFTGREVKKGKGLEILVNELKPGEYYITIQNRKQRFIKK